MWLFTNQGFISVVADRSDPETGNLLVRARDKKQLQKLFPTAIVFSKQPSDYRWRAWVPRDEVTQLVTDQVNTLNYTNFKDSIRDHKYHDACLDVWEVMHSAYRGSK